MFSAVTVGRGWLGVSRCAPGKWSKYTRETRRLTSHDDDARGAEGRSVGGWLGRSECHVPTILNANHTNLEKYEK